MIEKSVFVRTFGPLLLLALCLCLVSACVMENETSEPIIDPYATAAIPVEMDHLELIGYLGVDAISSLLVEGEIAYAVAGPQLLILDLSNAAQAICLGYVVFPESINGIALADSLVYVATDAGLRIIDVSDPRQLLILDTLYGSESVESVVISNNRVYVSIGSLRVLDITVPTAPVEMGVYASTDPAMPVGRVAAVVGEVVYTLYATPWSGAGGVRLIDVSDSSAPAEIGVYADTVPVHALQQSGDTLYLLVGEGVPYLKVVDVSDPTSPVTVYADPMKPWIGNHLTVWGSWVILVRPDSSGQVAHLQVLDVTDPAEPVLVGTCSDLPAPVTGVTLSKSRAYVATGEGVILLDISDPSKPQCINDFHLETLPGVGRNLATVGPYLFVAAGADGLLVVDVSVPSHPQIVGRQEVAGHVWDIALAGGMAYLAAESAGLRVLDVTDPMTPVEVGVFDPPGPTDFCHSIAVSGHYAFVADGNHEQTGVWVLDISEPAEPMEVTFLPFDDTGNGPPPQRVEEVVVTDDTLYVAAGDTGLHIFDISDPTAPVEVGMIAMSGRSDNLVVEESSVYVIDGDLRVVDVSDPTAPALVGFYDLPDSGYGARVAVQGERAVVTGQNVRLINVSDPGEPVVVDVQPFFGSGVAIHSSTVYVLGRGLYVFGGW